VLGIRSKRRQILCITGFGLSVLTLAGIVRFKTFNPSDVIELQDNASVMKRRRVEKHFIVVECETTYAVRKENWNRAVQSLTPNWVQLPPGSDLTGPLELRSADFSRTLIVDENALTITCFYVRSDWYVRLLYRYGMMN